MQGSAASLIRPRAPPRRCHSHIAAVAVSSRTRLRSSLRTARRSASASGGLTRAMSLRCARTSGPSFAFSMNSSALPLAGIMAKASGVGLCFTSEPRMLKSHAIESGSVRITASSAASRSRRCRSLILSAAATPASSSGWTATGPSGTGGRCDPQISSTGLRGNAFSVISALANASSSNAIPARVCSQGSKPIRAPLPSALMIHWAGAVSGICTTSKIEVGTWVGACKVYRPSTNRAALSCPMIAQPADPVNPVSHARRSADGGTYSPMCSSKRGTMTASTPSFLRRARSLATRSAPSVGSDDEVKSWNMSTLLYGGHWLRNTPLNDALHQLRRKCNSLADILLCHA